MTVATRSCFSHRRVMANQVGGTGRWPMGRDRRATGT